MVMTAMPSLSSKWTVTAVPLSAKALSQPIEGDVQLARTPGEEMRIPHDAVLAAGIADVLHPFQKFSHDEADLAARQLIAHAHMGAVAEGHVADRIGPLQVDRVGIGELCGVAVGGGPLEHDHRPLRYFDPGDFHIVF